MASHLWKRQQILQKEADQVLSELKLNEQLSLIGKPVQVGSSALGLMVWRDLDMTVICSKLNIDAVALEAAKWMTHQRVHKLQFINDSGSWNTDPFYPDGLYLDLKYQALSGELWNIDIWFIDQPEKQPDLKHIQTIPNQLTPKLKESILKIKHFWSSKPEYGNEIKSYDIYKAVLKEGVQTLDQFDEWLKAKRP